ncbi:hypothetical protein BU14_0021s0001 [Porphyra umbilicalis]|uniref:N-acetyltransferase domain-containing protein n=1 Tax=Porphyra umbilicalis TaxID=2786 RepID=A0A1X6PKQ7_PORUM|nr:hypothetical protein BU14_0021s0001 [Porphyra umbilicalis]|eukprot:OSX81395.1 hypothetical protein BU14_0021s0001 [Porphyra umbilicalis]
MSPTAFLSPPPPSAAGAPKVACTLPHGARSLVGAPARRWRPTVGARGRRAGGGPGGPRRAVDAPVAAAEQPAGGAGPPGVDLSTRKSQRSILGQDKRDVSPKKLNGLLVKAGRPPRDEAKWARAIEGSYILVNAKLLKTGELVAFARATSDQALNGTVWDVVVDPTLPDVPLMRKNVVKYLLNELRRTVPGCSVTLFSTPDDVDFFKGLEFVPDAEDVHGMALVDNPETGFTS